MIAKKRITFILGSMKRGGAERVISILCNHYADKNWNVDIILLLSGECEYTLNKNIKIIKLVNNKKSRISQLPNWIFGIRSYLKRYKPNSILSFAARINIITTIASIGIKKHLVVSERNDPELDGRSKLVEVTTKFIYPRVDRVVFQTKKAQNCFGYKVKNNSDIIYNPVKVNIKSQNLNSKKIVAVGRLEKQKNHELLINAFRDIHNLFPQYTLYIYGEGSLRDKLEHLITELRLERFVFMPGNIENIHEELSIAEIFVLSSDYEGLSNALLEAMMMGLPCISTECAGSNEIIVDGYNGLLVPIGSKDRLVDAIRKLIINRNLELNIGCEAIKTSNQFLSETILEKWEQVLETNNKK